MESIRVVPKNRIEGESSADGGSIVARFATVSVVRRQSVTRESLMFGASRVTALRQREGNGTGEAGQWRGRLWALLFCGYAVNPPAPVACIRCDGPDSGRSGR